MLVSEPGLLAAGVLPGGGYDQLFELGKVKFAIQIAGDKFVTQRLMSGGAGQQPGVDGIFSFFD